MQTEEVIVIGGGLAGSAAAALLAAGGRSVTLLEKDTFPRDKLCGEFLSPESTRALAAVGALEEVKAAAPAHIDRARFTAASGATALARLPGLALGLSRRRLDAILFRRAAAAGVRVVEGAEVRRLERTGRGTRVVFSEGRSDAEAAIEATLVVAAHGRRTRLDSALDRPFMAQASPYVGLKCHHLPDPGALRPALEGHVEVHAFDGGYCGMSFVEGGTVNVCALVEKRVLDLALDPATRAEAGPGGVLALDRTAPAGAASARRSGHATFAALTAAMRAANAALAARLDALVRADEPVQAVAQIPFEPKERYRDGVVFIGDAAGMIAPLAGDGQAMALESARLFGAIVARAPRRLDSADVARIARAWDGTFRRRFAARLGLGRALQRVLLTARTADLALRALRGIPYLADILVRATRG